MKQDKLRQSVLWGVLFVIIALALWLFGKYIFEGLIPFIIAYFISLAVKPASEFISAKTKVGKRFIAVFLIIVIITVLFFFTSRLISLLIDEFENFSEIVSVKLSSENNILKRAVDFFRGLKEKVPFLKNGDASDSLYEGMISVIRNALSDISSFIASRAAAFIGRLPGFIFALVTAIISVFYICTDTGALAEEAEFFIGKGAMKRTFEIKKNVTKAVGAYMKSYLILMLLTFAELLLGFIIIGIENAFLLALVISVIDLLPVLGSGTVTVPWAAVNLIMGNYKVGIGLLILSALMYVVRQFAEPHIVGTVMGIHPFLSLFSVYIGFVLFGICGIIFFPILLYLTKIVISESRKTTSG